MATGVGIEENLIFENARVLTESKADALSSGMMCASVQRINHSLEEDLREHEREDTS